jgi:hypothetical protein
VLAILEGAPMIRWLRRLRRLFGLRRKPVEVLDFVGVKLGRVDAARRVH